MKNSESKSVTSRRDVMKLLAAGSTIGLLGLFESPLAGAEKYETPAYSKGLAAVKITSVRAIATAPMHYTSTRLGENPNSLDTWRANLE